MEDSDLRAWAAPPSGGVVLPESFFARRSDTVGPELIGKILWRRDVGGGRLTEVEAYLPAGDPASHSARGRTRRNAAMFGPPGCVYLFLSYGIHVCLNVVCDAESVGSAVLIRSFEPMGDVRRLAENRYRGQVEPPRTGPRLTCGPGRVGQALGLQLGLNGARLGEESGVFLLDDGVRPPVGCTARVGISQGISLPLRYYLAGSAYVTKLGPPRRGERA